jgi:hypothetical protein
MRTKQRNVEMRADVHSFHRGKVQFKYNLLRIELLLLGKLETLFSLRNKYISLIYFSGNAFHKS